MKLFETRFLEQETAQNLSLNKSPSQVIMTSMTPSPLLVEREGSVLILRLNRPGKLNALNNTLISAISTALKNYELDKTVRCVIITGAGRAFSAGT